VYVAVFVPDVALPLTVTEYVPDGVLADVEMVRVDDPPDVTDDGLNDALAPLGRPEAENDTVCADPLVVAVATVVETEPPAVTEPEVGESATEKSLVGGGVVPLFT
jgi:hypothetical protein